MHKIKVLHVVLDMDLGGLQRIVNLLAKGVNKDRFTPFLCCLDRGGLFYDGLKLICNNMCILGRRPGPFDAGLFLRLCRIVKKWNIDIIHSHNGCSFYSALAGRLTLAKGIIHTDHGRLVPDKTSAILEDRIASWMLDRFVGVSEELTNYLSSKVRVSRKKLLTIINGVDTNRFTPLDSARKKELGRTFGLNGTDKILGTVCRLDPIKNLSFLIGCMPIILETVPQCKLMIVGDGPSNKDLVLYTKNLGLENKVLFVGRSSDIENVISIFDLYVCTSLSEGTSMTILEAMSCGLPIVASAVGGNPSLVDGSNGILVDVNDGKEFTRVIADLLNFPGRLAEMGANSRRIAEARFSLDRMVEEYQDLYHSVSNVKV